MDHFFLLFYPAIRSFKFDFCDFTGFLLIIDGFISTILFILLGLLLRQSNYELTLQLRADAFLINFAAILFVRLIPLLMLLLIVVVEVYVLIRALNRQLLVQLIAILNLNDELRILNIDRLLSYMLRPFLGQHVALIHVVFRVRVVHRLESTTRLHVRLGRCVDARVAIYLGHILGCGDGSDVVIFEIDLIPQLLKVAFVQTRLLRVMVVHLYALLKDTHASYILLKLRLLSSLLRICSLFRTCAFLNIFVAIVVVCTVARTDPSGRLLFTF